MLTRLRTTVYTTVGSAEQCDEFVVLEDAEAAAPQALSINETARTETSKAACLFISYSPFFE